MRTSFRAPAAVLLLAGTYLLAAAELAVAVVVVLVLLRVLPTAAALAVAAPLCFATVGALTYALRFLRTRPVHVVGVPVTRSDAPALWALADELAAGAAARGADTLTVVADADVRVVEHTRMLGLIGGRRELVLGLPILQALDVGHLRALLAHEFAHDARHGGRWTPIVGRGRLALDRAVARTGRRNPAGAAFRGWAALYRRFAAPLLDEQERAADGYAARAAGPAAATDVLRDLPMLAMAQHLFLAEYVGPGWQAGHVPDDLFGGFLRVLAARADDLTRWHPDDRSDPRHRPLAERLAGIAALPPDTPSPADGGEPAGALVPELPGLGRALQARVYPPHGRTTVGWDEFFGAARTTEMQRDADAALDALSAATPDPAGPQPAGSQPAVPEDPSAVAAPVGEVTDAAQVLELAAAGLLVPAARRVFPELDERQATAQAAELVKLLLALAALRSGAARWRHSWTGTAELVTADGDTLDVGELAELAVGPDGADKLRQRLTELGIDPRAGARDASAGARVGVVGGLVNLLVDGTRTDVLVTDGGLLLLPGLPRQRAGGARHRLAEVAAADDATRRNAVPGSRFLPYAEVTAATQTRRTPRTWQIECRDGTTVVLRAGLDSAELSGGWAALDAAAAFLQRGR